jgi:hypothetical protein
MGTDVSRRLPPLWPFLLICAAVSVWIDFGTLHRGEHADTLLVALNSLYRWTPYAWELDRYGDLVPLLAIPFRHPLANLLVQQGLNVFCTLAAFLLLSRYVLRDASYPVVGLLGAASFLVLPSAYYRSEILLNSGYGLWLTLGLAALLLAEQPPAGRLGRVGLGLAALLMVMAHWVWFTAALFLGPVVLFRGLVGPASPGAAPLSPALPTSRWGQAVRTIRRGLQTQTAVDLLLLVVGGAGGLVLRRYLAPRVGTDFGSLPPAEWLSTLRQLVRNTWFYLNPAVGPFFLAAAGGAGLLWAVIPAQRRRSLNAFRAAAALTLAAVLLALFMATRLHVRTNLFAFRYLAQSVLFFQTGLLALAVGPPCLAARGAARKGTYAGASALLAAAAIFAYGFPSFAGVRADLAVRRLPTPLATGLLPTFQPVPGMSADEILAAECTHVAGDYWQVWPAVFETNLKMADRHVNRVVWGVTFRSSPTRRYWSRTPLESMRVAVPPGDDPLAALYLKDCGFPLLVVAEKLPTIWVLRPKSVVDP